MRSVPPEGRLEVPEGPQKQRAEADGVGEDIMRWLGAGGAEYRFQKKRIYYGSRYCGSLPHTTKRNHM